MCLDIDVWTGVLSIYIRIGEYVIIIIEPYAARRGELTKGVLCLKQSLTPYVRDMGRSQRAGCRVNRMAFGPSPKRSVIARKSWLPVRPGQTWDFPAETRSPWPACAKVRPWSIWAPAEVWMSFSRRPKSGLRGAPWGLT